jgi:hypothetical protein
MTGLAPGVQCGLFTRCIGAVSGPILAAEVKRSVEKPDFGGDTGLRRKGPSGFFLR